MITEIWLQKWEDYTSEKKPDSLELGRMNVFIGRNNSGKSRLLRALYSSDKADFYYNMDSDDLVYYKEFLSIFSQRLNPSHVLNDIHAPQLSKIAEKKFSLLSNEQRNLLNKIPKTYEMLQSGTATGNMDNNKKSQMRHVLDRYHNENSHLKKKDLELTKAIPDIYYIPTLRGMRPVSTTGKQTYKNRTIKDYFESTEIITKNIYTGETLYDLLQEHLLGEPHERIIVSDYENALSTVFFEGQTVTLIPRHKTDVVYVKIGDEEQRPIYDLGDGLQSIIIITSIAFLTAAESIILIEEPEHHLHPGMLRQLILFLLEKTPHQHQYFVTSHSNHLLEFADERDDVRIHKVAKKLIHKKAAFNISGVVRDRELLLDLGVKSSSLYLANCTIWVEGITDRLYLQAYLKKYISSLEHTDTDKYTLYKKYTENYHYAFVEYQGGNLVHWVFDDDEEEDGDDKLKALLTTPHIFLIADGDIKGKGDRVAQLEAQLGNQFYLLKGKEIENLIPVDIVKNTARKMFESFKRKTYDKKIDDIEKLAYKNYVHSTKGIGYHIDKYLGLKSKGNKNTHLIFAANSGTLKDKTKFCTLATDFMQDSPNDWELTPQITELCEKILGHIERHNKLG
ncbi:MAG TPA: ATP-binding protein [Gammaproteobacteria bacterium]|nr:ATP-binding protein [Gammaproteobacteria bacterium]